MSPDHGGSSLTIWLRMFMEYAMHRYGCRIMNGGDRCTCGYQTALELAQKLDTEGVKMERLQWMSLWDCLRKEIETGNTSYGKNQLLALMDRLEREEVRRAETSPDETTIKGTL